MTEGQKFDTINFDCGGQRLFYSFITGCGDSRPRNHATKRKTTDRPNHINYNLKRVSENLFKIKHWEIKLGDYTEIENQEATWFIDPPYQFGGAAYPMSNKKIDYENLSQWCKERSGQVLVCENTKADWLPFAPIKEQRGSLFTTTEALWMNQINKFNNIQQKLF